MESALARAVLALVWLLSALPMALQARIGRGVGRLMHALARERRRVAATNLALCLPELDAAARDALLREHFALAGRSLLERGLLWHASAERLKRLLHVEGDVGFAERHPGPVMWLVPHFLALEVAGAATQLFQRRMVVDVYAPQSVAAFDAALLKGRGRFGRAEFLRREDGARAIVRAIRGGRVFFNAPDMDFGLRDAAFVPFFGQPAATLLAPSRLARSLGMAVQPIVAEILPGGQGYRVVFGEPWTDWPSDDPQADAARMNAFIEAQIRQRPAQYLWLHKRFKARPPGAPPVY
ncbi:MAG: lipid A biosynthesis acyltransferase [Burkholderiaceae bacterium]|nr:lipid A biosynthesis acyltransferase [Burkholderiaceae bacterium]MCZ8174128.1 lipid A biosynthesis acyltransferase [Burkholderiaceae bacterium]